MKFKTIKLRNQVGKVIYQFDVTDAQIELSEKFGVPKEEFIKQLAQLHLAELEHTKNEI